MASVTTGQEVASTSAVGAQKPGATLLSGLARGISGLFDAEVARRSAPAATPDRADVANALKQNTPRESIGGVISNLQPWQLGGIAVAGLLAVGLFAGWFRPRR